MLLVLVGNNRMWKLKLPKIANGNYWMEDTSGQNSKKLLNIQGKNGYWVVDTTNEMKILNPKNVTNEEDLIKLKPSEDMVIDKIVLKENEMYYVNAGADQTVYALLCLPSYENNFIHIQMQSDSSIAIGSSRKCQY